MPNFVVKPSSFDFHLNLSEKQTVRPMRPRQNTWPRDRAAISMEGLSGRDRKKEQNRLASRRFRVRRKIEMSVCEVQVAVLERRNTKLRRICDDFTKKITVMKDVLEQLNGSIPQTSLSHYQTGVTPNFKALTQTFSGTPSSKDTDTGKFVQCTMPRVHDCQSIRDQKPCLT